MNFDSDWILYEIKRHKREKRDIRDKNLTNICIATYIILALTKGEEIRETGFLIVAYLYKLFFPHALISFKHLLKMNGCP